MDWVGEELKSLDDKIKMVQEELDMYPDDISLASILSHLKDRKRDLIRRANWRKIKDESETPVQSV